MGKYSLDKSELIWYNLTMKNKNIKWDFKYDVEKLDSALREEYAIVTLKSDGNYKIRMKKKLINADGSDAGWLYHDIPNARLDEHDKYVIEPPKEDKIGNRAERRKLKRKKR